MYLKRTGKPSSNIRWFWHIKSFLLISLLLKAAGAVDRFLC